MKLKNLKGQKLIEPIYFRFLREKFLFWGKCLKLLPKQIFFTFVKKLIHSCFFFIQKWFLKEFFVILQKAQVWKKSGFKMQYFWSSISLERIKRYLSYFSWSWSSSKGSIWKSSSLIGCCQVCLSCNQVVWFFDYQYLGRESSYILVFYAWSESSRKGSIWDYWFSLCLVS